MKTRSLALLLGMLGLVIWLVTKGPAQGEQPQDEPVSQDGVSVLTRGPVHEAYAEPSETQPRASTLVTKQLPEPVEEAPPDQKPEGDNVQWIPGYWQWDGDSQDFLWVSGFWRDVPPGRRWTPGTWEQVKGGWQWVAGYWAMEGQQEMEYLPAPPPTLDQGPSTPAPDENSTYVPGCWVHRETRFFWRPGFWAPFRPDWCWTSDHYVWTPGGCLFVSGFWDYPLHERGLLFAPIRFERARLREGFRYVPQYVVQPDFLMSALFVRPASCHYYFGDYFEKSYERKGFTPWIDYRLGRNVYDPNFSWYQRRYAGDRHWESNLRDLYVGRRNGEIPRPPRTLVQQQEIVKNLVGNKTTNINVVKSISVTNIQNVTALTPLRQAQNMRVTALAALARTGGTDARPTIKTQAIKLETVSREQQAQHQKAAEQLRQVAVQRGQQELKVLQDGKAPVKPTDPPHRIKLDPPKLVTPLPQEPKPGQPPPPGSRPGRKVPPPVPTPPKHEDRPIPPHEPPKPVRPATTGPAGAPHPASPAPHPVPPAPHPASPPPHPAPPPPASRPASPAPHPAPPPPAPPHPAPPPPPPPKRPADGKHPTFASPNRNAPDRFAS